MSEISVVARAGAASDKVEKVVANKYRAWVTISPEAGRANLKIVELMERYLNKPESSLAIVRGHKTKHKTIEIS